jgi:glucose-6-phosphate isomerase
MNELRSRPAWRALEKHYLRWSATCPVLMGMLAVWYVNFFGAQTAVVLPYEHYCRTSTTSNGSLPTCSS